MGGDFVPLPFIFVTVLCYCDDDLSDGRQVILENCRFRSVYLIIVNCESASPRLHEKSLNHGFQGYGKYDGLHG